MLHSISDTNSNLAVFSVTGWTGDDDKISMSGGCYFPGNNMVLWSSKMHNGLSISTAKS